MVQRYCSPKSLNYSSLVCEPVLPYSTTPLSVAQPHFCYSFRAPPNDHDYFQDYVLQFDVILLLGDVGEPSFIDFPYVFVLHTIQRTIFR